MPLQIYVVDIGGHLDRTPAIHFKIQEEVEECTYPQYGGYMMSKDAGSEPFQHHVPPLGLRSLVMVLSCYEAQQQFW